jgi:hypothetical protein
MVRVFGKGSGGKSFEMNAWHRQESRKIGSVGSRAWDSWYVVYLLIIEKRYKGWTKGRTIRTLEFISSLKFA